MKTMKTKIFLKITIHQKIKLKTIKEWVLSTLDIFHLFSGEKILLGPSNYSYKFLDDNFSLALIPFVYFKFKGSDQYCQP